MGPMAIGRTGSQPVGWCDPPGVFIVAPVRGLATQLLGRTDLGNPHGVTTQDHWVRQLWHITYWFAVPIGLLVLGLILWCVFRYRVKGDGSEGGRKAAQFQYHIPIEAAYTILPLVIVAVVFGFMYNAENHVDKVSKTPAVKITVEGFQWGWRFTYPNGHEEVGTVADALNINSDANLPILYLPAGETVQLHLISDDVIHTFYVPEFLFQRDMIPGIDNTVDFNVTTTGTFHGECNNICGQYHAYMRFMVDVMPQAAYNTWYQNQQPCSINTAGQPPQLRSGLTPGTAACPTSLSTESQTQ
jgi:cytochrome c oxidase subunit II